MNYPDYEEFLESCNARGVRYLVVGGFAYSFHAIPRATKDLDLFIDPTSANVEAILDAIREFFGGFEMAIRAEDLLEPGRIVQLGISPHRIDLMTRLASRVDFEDAWERRRNAKFGRVPAFFLDLDDLIREKESAGRPQDLADLAGLRRARERKVP
ncbi:MAG TPA: nucleotidyl transferase AbiEii/AbiGii toxin family protein [Thermoanaerobaculia bacterium]|nr:nucleotidyl transferase AbiEii/AbiGii toxin family protein [Thermoanaerobaculia bacterium]